MFISGSKLLKIKGVINFISLGIILFLFVRIISFALTDYDSLVRNFRTNWEESYPVKRLNI